VRNQGRSLPVSDDRSPCVGVCLSGRQDQARGQCRQFLILRPRRAKTLTQARNPFLHLIYFLSKYFVGAFFQVPLTKWRYGYAGILAGLANNRAEEITFCRVNQRMRHEIFLQRRDRSPRTHEERRTLDPILVLLQLGQDFVNGS